ncbi:MAG: hypothetical protein ACRC0G_13505 [Fusobacteriaceae bacterium]
MKKIITVVALVLVGGCSSVPTNADIVQSPWERLVCACQDKDSC